MIFKKSCLTLSPLSLNLNPRDFWNTQAAAHILDRHLGTRLGFRFKVSGLGVRV